MHTKCWDLLSSREVFLWDEDLQCGVSPAVVVGTWAPVMWETMAGRSVEWPGALLWESWWLLLLYPWLWERDWEGLISGSILVIMVWMSGVAMTSRVGSIMPVISVRPVACQCARWWYLIRAVHGNMSIIITIVALYVGEIACHMANFLTLKASVIITGHSVDWWGGQKCGSYLLCGLEFFTFLYCFC